MLSDKKKKKIGNTGLVFLLLNKIGKFLTHSKVKVTLSELSALIFELPPLCGKVEKKLNKTKIFCDKTCHFLY